MRKVENLDPARFHDKIKQTGSPGSASLARLAPASTERGDSRPRGNHKPLLRVVSAGSASALNTDYTEYEVGQQRKMEPSDEDGFLKLEEDFPLSSCQQRIVSLADESEDRWLGPMPPEKFLSEFLSLPQSAPNKEICFKSVATAENIVDMATRFIKAANEADLPKLSFVDASTSETRHFEVLQPAVVGVSDMAHVRYYRAKNGERKAFVDLGYSELLVECKGKRSDDAFNDHDQDLHGSWRSMEPCAWEEDPDDMLPFEHGTDAARATRGQLATYATAQSDSQFRTHSFSLFIFGPFARFIRWDRSCAIVSARFEYGTSPSNYLADFLHRYSLLDDKGRGQDPTFASEPCLEGDCPPDIVEQLHKANQQKLTSASLPRTTELRRVLFPDLDDWNMYHPHIISYPLPFVTRPPFGRSTRQLLAYNPATQRIVFVKDYWRSTAKGVFKEGDIYKRLEEKRVRHVPPFGHGNDIASQKTIDCSRWVEDLPEALQHYRMSLKVIGTPLQEFPSTRVLVSAVADAMEGHDGAFWDADILHRDISMGNILIAQDQGQYRGHHAPADEEVDNIQAGSGLLIDWELSTPVHSKQSPYERTGTWPFISVALLIDGVGLPPHTMEDDRESSFYAILYLALRYSKHQGGDETLAQLRVFDEFIPRTDGLPTGGELKEFLINDTRPYPITFNPPLDGLVAGAKKYFRPRYTFPSEEDKERYHKFKARGVDDELLNEDTYGRYLVGLDRIQARGSWVAFLRDKLKEDGWPSKDFQIQKLELPVTAYRKPKMWYYG
ncbi:hypothetical protein MD484_g4207, partial [Candolleomyces efflorescens]